MKNVSNTGNVLFGNEQLGPFPMHRLKHVGKPTSLITDSVQKVDVRENAFSRAARGDYGPAAKRATAVEARDGISPMSAKYPLSAAQMQVLFHLSSIKDNDVVDTKAPIPEDPHILSRHIKRLGYFLKADIMGICRIPKSAIYSYDGQGNPIDIDYPNAIVIVMSKEYSTLNASTGYDWIGNPVSYQAYLPLAFVAHTMANYIRRLGYRASAQHNTLGETKYQVLLPPLLLWAGIGEGSRAGIILNPFLGLAFKAAAVLTDLPLEPDKPIDFGLQDFCQHCKICAEICPSKAIPMGNKVMYNGYETWKLNEQRCASYSLLNRYGTICERCIKVCPWTKPNTWPHNLVRWGVEHSSIAKRLAVKASSILGPEKANEKEKWWFDLEDVDGVLRIPQNSSD